MNEMRASGRRQVVFLCIGTDRSTGDSLGPLIGSRLEAEQMNPPVQGVAALCPSRHLQEKADFGKGEGFDPPRLES